MTPGRGERTLPALFEESVSKFPDHTFLLEKIDGKYRPITYRETREYVLRCAAGLVAMGIGRGDRIALLAEGRARWVIAELGILYAGAVNVPLSVKIEERSELKFRLEHAGCRMAVVSVGQAPKIRKLRGALPDLERLILLDTCSEDPGGGSEVTFASVLEAGEQWLASHGGDIDAVWRSVRECDPANICYTSGTVADPKGIILTHRNYTANIEQSVALYPLPDWFCTLLILPWDHSFAHTDGIYALAMCGGSIACVQGGKTAIETLRNIPGNIREVRPTFLLSVPALAKNFRKTVDSGVRAKGWGARLLFGAGLAVAFAYNADGFSRGKGWRKLLRPFCGLFDALLFRRIREGFGGRMEYFIGGGALLDVEMQKFFCAIGIPMYQGYGLTEAAPVISANTPRRHKFGSSGVLVPGLDLRICDGLGHDVPTAEKGEIVVRGENVMAGYWRNPDATSAALRDGWLYTGDIGYVDTDGFLFVLGREKSLLIGHDGEKYSPEGIEEYIVGHSPCVDQIMLYNNQSLSTVALLVPNGEAIVTWMAHHHRAGLEEPAGVEAALRMLEREIAKFRGGGEFGGLFPERWLPSAIGILDEPFSEQNRFLNSTMKMVRGKIASAYSERLAGLFTPEGRDILNEQNRRAIAALYQRTRAGSS
jgi:long-chain acyl-CoA synthetase